MPESPQTTAHMVYPDQKIAELIHENARLRTLVRVNLLRWFPSLSHEAIDKILSEGAENAGR